MGATLVLDSRYIAGLSDGSAISSWPDKSGNAYDPTQATAAARPTYKTAIQGGQPVARFDGGDSLYKNQNLSTVNELTVLVVCSFTNNTTRYAVFDAKNNVPSNNSFTIEQNTFNTAGQRYCFYTSANSLDSATSTSSGMKIISVAAATTSGNNIVNNTTYKVQGNTSALNLRFGGGNYSNLSGLNGFMVGGFNINGTAEQRINGDIANIVVLPSNTIGARMKRLEHAAAYSFKIACS